MFKADDSSALNAHFDHLQDLIDHISKHPKTYKGIRDILSHFKSLDLTLERVYAMETLSVTELFEIKHFVIFTRRLIDELKKVEMAVDLEALDEVESLLDPEAIGINSFYIYDGYSDELRLIRNRIRELDGQILKTKKEKRESLSNDLQIKIRPNDEVTVKKHDVSLIEMMDNHEDLLYVSDTMIHRTYKVKLSDECLHFQSELDRLRLEEEDEEYEIRTYLTKSLNNYLDKIRCNISQIGHLDLMMAKAYFALAFNMTRPRLGQGLKIKAGIHLKVQDHLATEGFEFSPIDIHLDRGVSVITGANMGGKTICLRLMGQMQMMAQYGLFVPCESFEFELQNYIFLSSQDAQSIDKGLSTFGAEMVNVSGVLNKTDKKGLILIDELARGTNPKEGYAISKAIINYLKDKSSVSVITTHFDGLADEEDVLHLQVKGLKHVDFEDLKINITNNLELIHQLMDYQLEVITSPEEVPKDAIRISKLMGVDKSILEDAKRILENREEE